MYTDLLIRIKNAEAVGKEFVKVPYSKMDREIAETLVRKEFLLGVEVKGRTHKKVMILRFNKEKPIGGVRFLSKPSIKRYTGYREVRKIKGGKGALILSTPKGVKTGEEARKEKVGGKVLFEVW